MSQPWMPLYVADYLADTGRLSTVEHGAYMLLIMDYWRNASLPNDDRKLARIARMSESEWLQIRDNLADLFLPEWKHKRIEGELAEAQKRSEAGRNAANKRWQYGRNADAMPPHCEPDAEPMPSQSQPQSQSDSECETRASGRSLSEKADEFYDCYPKHVDPRDAKSRFIRLAKSGVDPDRMISAAQSFAEAHRLAGTEKRFIPAPAVWLNKGSYDSDDLPTPPARAGPIANGFGTRNGKPSLSDFARAQDERVNGTGGEHRGESADEVRPLPHRQLPGW